MILLEVISATNLIYAVSQGLLHPMWKSESLEEEVMIPFLSSSLGIVDINLIERCSAITR